MTAPEPDNYALSPVRLQFRDPAVEASYRDEALKQTLWFCRGAWALIPLLGGGFGLLDHRVFGDNAPQVLTVRALLVAVALVVLAATFWRRIRPWLVTSSALYILLVGAFSTFLVAMDDRTTMSPYFMGLFLGFTAIYSTVGVGFRCSFPALVFTAALFVFTTGVLAPVSTRLLLIYSFFMLAVVVTFTYAAWLVERISRERYAASARLHQSLEEVKTLSGMLPICASCKKVRDDQGYWNQIESYICERSEAIFTHGICPSCAKEIYPEYVDDDG